MTTPETVMAGKKFKAEIDGRLECEGCHESTWIGFDGGDGCPVALHCPLCGQKHDIACFEFDTEEKK